MINISTTFTETGHLMTGDELKEKIFDAIRKCCAKGEATASMGFAASPYDAAPGQDASVTVATESIEDGMALRASGPSVVFREFGSGAISGNHPMGGAFGLVPGSWSTGPYGKGHWADPNGWWLPGTHGVKSFGNPPARAMYDAAKTIETELRHEFGGG